MPAPHDPAYRQFFSHPRMVQDLLQAFVHEDWVAELDFTTLERINAHFVTQRLRKRESDVVWRVRRRDEGEGQEGEWLYLYLLLEFQSQPDPWMALRMWVYVGLLYQHLAREKSYRGKRLPPVFPLVLYNGIEPWQGVQELAELIQPAPGDLGRYQPRMRYLLLDEGALGDVYDPASQGNLAAILVYLENSRIPEELRSGVRLLIRWLHAPEQAELRSAFNEWLRQVLLPGKLQGIEIPNNLNRLEEVDSMLAERVKSWTEEWERRGMEKGIEKGMEKGLVTGRSEFLKRQMTRKYGPLTEAQQQRVDAADAEQLLLWGERILFADTPEAMFGD